MPQWAQQWSVFVVFDVSKELPDVVVHKNSLSGIRVQDESLPYCIAVQWGSQ